MEIDTKQEKANGMNKDIKFETLFTNKEKKKYTKKQDNSENRLNTFYFPKMRKSYSNSRMNIQESEPTVGLNENIKDKYRYFYRPYKESMQKGVNKSLKFNQHTLQWMNVADMIINTKPLEFDGMIELYQENHNAKNFKCPQRANGSLAEFFRKKKKNKKNSIMVPNYDYNDSKDLNAQFLKSQSPNMDTLEHRRRQTGLIILSKNQIEMINKYNSRQNLIEESFRSLNEFSDFLKSMKKLSRSKPSRASLSKTHSDSFGIKDKKSILSNKSSTNSLNRISGRKDMLRDEKSSVLRNSNSSINNDIRTIEKVRLKTDLNNVKLRMKYAKSQEKMQLAKSSRLSSIPEVTKRLYKNEPRPFRNIRANVSKAENTSKSNKLDYDKSTAPSVMVLKSISRDKRNPNQNMYDQKKRSKSNASNCQVRNINKRTSSRQKAPEFDVSGILAQPGSDQNKQSLDGIDCFEDPMIDFQAVLPSANLNTIKLDMYCLERPHHRKSHDKNILPKNLNKSKSTNNDALL